MTAHARLALQSTRASLLMVEWSTRAGPDCSRSWTSSWLI